MARNIKHIRKRGDKYVVEMRRPTVGKIWIGSFQSLYQAKRAVAAAKFLTEKNTSDARRFGSYLFPAHIAAECSLKDYVIKESAAYATQPLAVEEDHLLFELSNHTPAMASPVLEGQTEPGSPASTCEGLVLDQLSMIDVQICTLEERTNQMQESMWNPMRMEILVSSLGWDVALLRDLSSLLKQLLCVKEQHFLPEGQYVQVKELMCVLREHFSVLEELLCR